MRRGNQTSAEGADAIPTAEKRDQLGEELQAFFVKMPRTLGIPVTDCACRLGHGAGSIDFAAVQFRVNDGKVGQLLLIFGDDFTLLAQPTIPVPTLDVPGIIGLEVLLACVGGGLVRRFYASR